MSTDVALLVARSALAAVFATAAAAKLLDRAATRRTLVDFGFPAPLVRPTAVALPLAEAAVAVLLLPLATAAWSAVAALALLLVFVVAMAWSLARGRRPRCNCFGQRHSAPVGAMTLARTGGLAAAAGWLVLMGPGASVDATVLLVLAFGAQAWLSWQLLRQHGRLLLRIRALEVRLAPAASRIGEPAPAVSLTDLDGRKAAIPDLLDGERELLLVFTDPACGACDPLLPDIARAQASDGARVAVIGRGEPEPNRTKLRGHGIGEALLQRDFEAAGALGISGVPGAILIGADGRVASEPAVGSDRLRILLGS